MQDLILEFFRSSSAITLFVLCWLALYLFLTLWIFLFRFISIILTCRDEDRSLRMLISGDLQLPTSVIVIQGIVGDGVNREVMQIWKHRILQQASKGLTFLGIVASTAPFIGLFGTVVEILEAFSRLTDGGQVSFDIVAPIISKALVATASGILTAIPAYSFHLVLKRKIYDLSTILQMEFDYLFSRRDFQQQIRF